MMFALFYIGSTKETMLLNINKSNQVYQIEKDMVTNDYVFLISNTDSHKHEFALEVADNENITIIRPTKPFEVGAESKMKKIVKLATSKDLSNGASVTTRIPVMIKAYAVDEKDKIFVYREAIFAYPPQNEIRK
jgi:polyferredoxin